MMEQKEHTVVDIDRDFAAAIRIELDSAAGKRRHPEKHFTIFRVPQRIRRGKECFFEPSFVAIGPYHHKKDHLQPMQEQKWQQLQDFLARNHDNSLEMYISNLRGLEARARSCYFDHIDLPSKEFVQMLLLDSCFIVEFLLKYYEFNVPDYSYASIPSSKWFHDQILEDLIVLENQIPFFVVQSMFEFVYDPKTWGDAPEPLHKFTNIAAGYLANISPSTTEVLYHFSCKADDIDHLLHLYYKCIVPPAELTESNHKSFLSILMGLLGRINPLRLLVAITISYWKTIFRPSATEAATTNISCASKLVEAGVRFKKRKGKPFIDIAFRDGVLQIPRIVITDNTLPCMYNMVALEQFNDDVMTISTYARFMDFLIDTPKDVEILQECGIIDSYLKSNEEVALFFNQFHDYVFIEKKRMYLDPLCEDIIKFSESNWQKNRAKLVRDYFSNPWATSSFIAAIFLLILTSTQTFFAVFSYFHPPN